MFATRTDAEQPSYTHLLILDYARATAVMMVFFCHAYGYSTKWGTWFRDYYGEVTDMLFTPVILGTFGVAVFFFISGFCIHTSFHRQGKEWRSFFIRRFFRIYPPYLAALLLFALFFPGTKLEFIHLKQDLYMLFMHVFLIHNYDRSTYLGINEAFWSIAVEVQLYLIYPIFLLLVKRFGWKKTLIGMAGCEAVICTIYGMENSVTSVATTFGFDFSPTFLRTISHWHWLTATPLAYWFTWSLGAYVADTHLRARKSAFTKLSSVPWLVLIPICFLFHPLLAFDFAITAVLTAIVISRMLERPVLNVCPNAWQRFILKLGLWSYSIYLLHLPFQMLLRPCFVQLFPTCRGHIIWFAVGIATGLISIPLAITWYEFLEKPSKNLGKKIIEAIGNRQTQTISPPDDKGGGHQPPRENSTPVLVKTEGSV
jgi:peptidoglycan/LPS O-acetylase OafA/YrhL